MYWLPCLSTWTGGYLRSTKVTGLTFIEVLVALVIIVTGILGAIAMQASAKKGAFDSMQRSLASSLAQDIVERMRSNSSNPNILELYEGTYGAALNALPSPRCNSNATLCTPTQLVASDLYEWELSLMGADVTQNASNRGGLVGARGCIQHAANAVIVVISWEGREGIADGGASNSDFAKSCGTSGSKRRQIAVEAFVF